MIVYAKIMNMRVGTHNEPSGLLPAYKRGHNAARHAAAELVLEADIELAELRLLLRGIVENRSACFIPNDRDGLFDWDGRAARVLGDA